MSGLGTPDIAESDPFDLPEWLGVHPVTWFADDGHDAGHLIHGRLHLDDADARELVDDVVCDVLAIDQAYPHEVANSGWRRLAHQAWHNGEVLLVEYDGRLTLAVPGHHVDSDDLLHAVARFARSVGGRPDDFTVALRLGAVLRRTGR